MSLLRNAYVNAARMMRKVFEKIGFLRWLDRHKENRFFHWLRSQFSIYDFEDLAEVGSPWWSYGSIDYVEKWLTKRKGKTKAFEWGSGSSTLWLAPRVDQLHSIEHDMEFAEKVRKLAPSNVSLDAIEPSKTTSPKIPSSKKGFENLDFSDYVNSISATEGKYDMICIDGRARVACLEIALNRVSDDGIIVLDNSGRKEYQDAMSSLNLDVEDFRGWAPALPYKSRTSIIHSPTKATK